MPDEEEERQCRICFEGVEAERELGRLIRPCLCRGSISVCHQQHLNIIGFRAS
jgi:E3 ubiquitin-protein ligase DOA10